MASVDLPDAIESAAKKAKFDGKAEFSAYLEYNRILRSWFVAFGVGGPALFLINPQVRDALIRKEQLANVALLFLIGTGSQVFGAVLNKVSNWYVYRGADDAAYREQCKYKFFNSVVEHFWIDILLDVATILLFGFASWRLLTVFGNTQ